MGNTTNTDQFRKLANFLYVSGELVDCERTREGVDKNGVNYVSTTCTVRIGEEKGTEMICSLYISALRRDFDTGKNVHNDDYDTLFKYMNQIEENKKIVERGNQEEIDAIEPIMVCLTGSLTDNPWYDKKKNELRKNSTKNEMRGFGKFKESGAKLTIEGYIMSISDEEDKDGKLTGRKLVRVISKDKSKDRNTLDIRFVLPVDLVEPFEDNDFDEEKTAVFNVAYNTIVKEKPKSTHGFGETPGGGSYVNLERVIVGGTLVEKEEDEITPAQVKVLLKERDMRCAQIEKEGKSGDSSAPTRGTFGSTGAKKAEDTEVNDGFITAPEDDDDMNW